MIVASDPRPFSFSELGQVPAHAPRRQAMKADKTSAALPSASTVASQSAQHSSHISPYSSSTTTVTSLPVTTSATVTSLAAASSVSSAGALGAMATPAFLPYPHAFRSAMPASSSYSSSRFFDREAPKPVGTPYSGSPSAMVPVLIRRLPINTSEESLRLMVVWSQELADVELLPLEKSEDTGFRSAILTFRTLAGAHEAKRMLDGRSNISNDAEMVVEILSGSLDSSRRYSPDTVSADPPSSASSASSGTGSHQPPRFNGAFQSLESTSPSSNSAFPGSELSFTDSSARFQNSFSPHSPLNNYLLDPQRISGKSLIANDSTDDDETSDLINDPIAYAENGSISQRRATAPQIPIGRMAGLSLNTNNPTPTGPSSMPPYMSPMSAHPLSPMNGSSPAVPYPMGNPPYRNNFPPVNPADQNPPCNTLYVGNLPVDTSEEELKAMFSKQRGYRRLCFRTKQNGPMCFVEFEDVSFATKALRDLYGHPLHNSVKGGIRLSFSKNPLGVRSGQAPSQNNSAALGAMSGMMPGPPGGFPTANGPPPGLAAPPGFASGRGNYPGSSAMNASHGQHYTPSTMNTGHSNPYSVVGFPGMTTSAWNGPMFGSSNSPAANFPPPHMMRR